MGKLSYGAQGDVIEFEDRVLAHLQIVIIAKLRRNEPFAFTWNLGQERGGGHSVLWFHPTVPLHFSYFGNRQPELNGDWIEQLMHGANAAQGLRLTPEPPAGG